MWVAVVSSVRCGRCGVAGGPVAGHPLAAGVGGMEWYGRSQAESIRNDDRNDDDPSVVSGAPTCNINTDISSGAHSIA